MDAETYQFFYFVLIVYRLVDLCCDWYCFANFKNYDDEGKMLVSCLVGTGLSVRYFRRAILNYRELPSHPFQDIGGITTRNIILPELNFNILEAIINIFQTFIGFKMSRTSCINLMIYRFERCCVCGSMLQFICFFKNLCGYGGETEQNVCNRIFSGVVSVVMLLFGFAGFEILEKQIC